MREFTETQPASRRISGDQEAPPACARHRAAAVVWTAGAAVVVVALAWAGWTYVLAGTIDDRHLTAHSVQTRSFSVVLKEKGELKAAESTDIKSGVEGRSTIISLIPEGTAAKEGDLLVELASNEIDDKIRSEELREASSLANFEAAKTELEIQIDRNASDIRKAKLKLELAELALKKYEEGDWVQAVKDAEVEIERAKIMLRRRTEDYKASKDLFEQTYITKTQLEEDEFNATKAQWDLEKAKLAKEVLYEYTYVKDLRQKKSDVEEAQKELERVKKGATAEEARKRAALTSKEKELNITHQKLAKLRKQKEQCRMTAPGPGLVVYYTGGGGRFFSSDSQIKEGATVYERQTIVTLVNTSKMNVAARIHESKTDKIALGQDVSVQVEGIPGKVFHGTITKIGVLAESQNRWINPDLKEYEVEIELDDTDHPLKPGVTAVAEILVKRVEEVLAAPVQAIFSKNGHTFVFRSGQSDIEPVKVETGVASTEWVEIKEGLVAGDHVLLAVNDNLMRLLPDLPPVRRTVVPQTRRTPPPGMQGRPMKLPANFQRGGGGKTVMPPHGAGKAKPSTSPSGDAPKPPKGAPRRGSE